MRCSLPFDQFLVTSCNAGSLYFRWGGLYMLAIVEQSRMILILLLSFTVAKGLHLPSAQLMVFNGTQPLIFLHVCTSSTNTITTIITYPIEVHQMSHNTIKDMTSLSKQHCLSTNRFWTLYHPGKNFILTNAMPLRRYVASHTNKRKLLDPMYRYN